MNVLAVSGTGGWATAVPTVVGALLLLADLAIKIAAVGIIPGNRKPSAAMAWLILILILPFAGLVVFLFLGRTNLGRGRLRRQLEAEAAIRAATDQVVAASGERPEDGPVYLPSVALLNRTLGSLPLQTGNRVELIPGYVDAIRAMTAAVAGSETSVEVEFYISAWDEVTARSSRRCRLPQHEGCRSGCCSTTWARAGSPATSSSWRGCGWATSTSARCFRSGR